MDQVWILVRCVCGVRVVSGGRDVMIVTLHV